VALLAALLWALVVAFVAHVRYGDDVRALLCIGGENTLLPAFATVPRAGPTGYDGHVYAALATDPFLHRFDTQNALDSPAYRATRIMIPLLAWLLALGNSAAAIVTYQLLCWGLGLVAILIAARWLATDGRSPWQAALLIGSAGLAAAMIRSTPDAGALCFMLAALWCHGRRRHALALAFASAAVLTRETSYLVVLAIAADELRRRRPAAATLFAAVPLSLIVGWQLYLKSVLGAAFATAGSNFSLPFAWLPAKFSEVLHGPQVWWQEVFGLAAIAATLLAMAALALRPAHWSAVEISFLAFGVMGLFLSYDVYSEAWAYGRVLIVLPFLALLIAGRQDTTWRRWPLYAVTVCYLFAGVAMTWWELGETRSSHSLSAAARADAVVASRPDAAPRRYSGAFPGEPLPATTHHQLFVLPVASSSGRAGARWQTRLELANLAATDNRIALELLPARRGAFSCLRTTITMAPGERRLWPNAVDALFGFAGAGALRLVAHSGPISARSLTVNVARGEVGAPWLPAFTEDRAIRSGESAVLRDLAGDARREAAVRTNVGVLNVTARPITIRVQATDARGRRLGQVRGELPALGFVQIDDLFARLQAGTVNGGSAVVESSPGGGAFLAYASVIRGPTAPVVYVFPERRYLRARVDK